MRTQRNTISILTMAGISSKNDILPLRRHPLGAQRQAGVILPALCHVKDFIDGSAPIGKTVPINDSRSCFPLFLGPVHIVIRPFNEGAYPSSGWYWATPTLTVSRTCSGLSTGRNPHPRILPVSVRRDRCRVTGRIRQDNDNSSPPKRYAESVFSGISG